MWDGDFFVMAMGGRSKPQVVDLCHRWLWVVMGHFFFILLFVFLSWLVLYFGNIFLLSLRKIDMFEDKFS